MKKIYVGNLAWATTNESLAAAFNPFGEVSSAIVMVDKMTGRSRGFGFVEMSTHEEALACLENLNASVQRKRQIVVKWKEEKARPPRGE
jgi:RNA recognition motif-containing protein